MTRPAGRLGGRGVSSLSYLPGPPCAAPRLLASGLEPPPRRTWRSWGGRRKRETPDGSGDRGSAIVPFLALGSPSAGPGVHSYPFSPPQLRGGRGGGMLEFGQTRGSWDLGRGAPARRLPQPLPRWVGTLSNPPSLRCRLGHICVRALVSAVFRVHLPPPGTRSPLRLDLTFPFCEGGPQSPGRQQTGQMETSVKWGS